MQRHQSDHASDSDTTYWQDSLENTEVNYESDFSEAFSIKTDEESDSPLDCKVIIKTYN